MTSREHARRLLLILLAGDAPATGAGVVDGGAECDAPEAGRCLGEGSDAPGTVSATSR